jgi:carboxyl-terminal processing protease
VAPTANDAAENHKPLPLDELRNRSTKRINKDPVFHDLSAEMHLIKQKLRDNRVSLNEKILRKEIAEKVRLQNKADADRITASGHDRTKYYRLMLADIDRHKLALQQKAELGSAQKHPVPADAAECSDSLTPHTLGQEDFGTATENEAITRETLNILSDLVSLEKTPLMATNAEIP